MRRDKHRGYRFEGGRPLTEKEIDQCRLRMVSALQPPRTVILEVQAVLDQVPQWMVPK